MKKSINLFTQQTSYQSALHFFRKSQKVALQLFIVCVLITIVEGVAYLSIKEQLNASIKTQKEYEIFVSTNAELDQKLRRFLYKNTFLEEIITNDVKPGDTYYLLQTALAEMGNDSKLESFSIDVNHKVTFRIIFPTYDSALQFLSTIEERSFLDYFTELELKQFTIRRGAGDQNVLEFTGVFKSLQT